MTGIPFQKLNHKTKLKPATDWFHATKTMSITFKIEEHQDKYDVLQYFTKAPKCDAAREITIMANEIDPSHDYGMIMPANGGYSYMRFFPKNNPTKFTFYFRGNDKSKIIR